MEDLDTFLQFHPKASRLTKPVTLTNINESFNLSSDEEETLPHRAASESSKTTINDSKLSKKSSKMCHGDDSIASHHDQTATTKTGPHKDKQFSGSKSMYLSPDKSKASTSIGTNSGIKLSPNPFPINRIYTYSYENFKEIWRSFMELYEQLDYERAFDTYCQLKHFAHQKMLLSPDDSKLITFKMVQIEKKGQFAEMMYLEMKKALSYLDNDYLDWKLLKKGDGFCISHADDHEKNPFVMLEGIFQISVKELFALFHEVERIPEWFPQAKVAIELDQIEKMAKIKYLSLKMPLSVSDREVFLLTTPVNHLATNGSLLLLCIPITKDTEKAKQFRVDITSPNGYPELVVRTLVLELVPVTESVLKLKAVCSVDPDVQFVGATVKNYFAKKCGVGLIESLAKACRSDFKWKNSTGDVSEDYEWLDTALKEYLKIPEKDHR